MYPSTCKTFLIIVLSYLTIECAGPPNCTKFDEEVAECLKRFVVYYGIPDDDSRFTCFNYLNKKKTITGLQCAKNAIKYLVHPSKIDSIESSYYEELKNNLDSGNIKSKLEFCNYKTSIFQCSIVNIDLVTQECLDELHEYPDNAEEALKFALTDVVLIPRMGSETKYLNHMSNDVKVTDSLTQPLQYCQDKLKEINENTNTQEDCSLV